MAKIFVGFNIVSTSDFLLVARETDNPLAEVYRSDVLEPPHTQRNITITGLRPVMHSVELWTTLDGITLDLLRGKCDIDASIDTKIAFKPIQFIPGNGRSAPHYDPVIDQNEWPNPDITLSYDPVTDSYNFVVFKSGFGAVDIPSHIELLTDGKGFKWSDSSIFSEGEEYTVMINELVQLPVSEDGAASYPSGIVSITEATTFSNTHYGKILMINGSDPVVPITIDAMETVPENTMFTINTHGGTQNYCSLILPVGAYCLINRVQRNPINIRPGEQVQFIKSGSTLVLVNGGENFIERGRRIFADNTPPINALNENGAWLLKADYPGFFGEYVDNLTGSDWIPGTDDSNPAAEHDGKFVIGTTKFRMPKTTGYVFKGAGSGRQSSTVEEPLVGDHTHPGMSSVRTGSHGASSSGVSGPMRLLVNTTGSSGTNDGEIIGVVNSNAAGENTVRNLASYFYRLL